MFFNAEENKTRRLQKHRVMEVLTTGPPNSRQRFDRKIWQEFFWFCVQVHSAYLCPLGVKYFQLFVHKKEKEKKESVLGPQEY